MKYPLALTVFCCLFALGTILGCGGALSAQPPAAAAAGTAASPPRMATISVDGGSDLGKLGPHIFGGSLAPHPDPVGLRASKEVGFKLLGVAVNLTTPTDPSDPGQYDFTDLDRQVQAVLDSGAEPLVVFFMGTPPANVTDYGAFAANVAKHLTQGWAGGHTWPVKIFRFGNEPQDRSFWSGTQEQFFQTYASWARALKAVDETFILDTPGLARARDDNNPDLVNPWIPALLSYCQRNHVPVDYLSFHIYSIFPPAYYDDTLLVSRELKKYPGLSPAFGTPRVANDEWNIGLGDSWSGRYSTYFDTAWPAPLLVSGLIEMVDAGLMLSTPMFGTFNGGVDGCHDFPLVDSQRRPKPAYHAIRGFNWLAGATRLSITGATHMNLTATAGKTSSEIIVVVANQDLRGFIDKFEPAGSPAHAVAEALFRQYEDATYDQLKLTLTNSPWPASRVERYLVDETHALELVETQVLPSSGGLSCIVPMSCPSVQVLKIRQAP